jgi:hypothetical protein
VTIADRSLRLKMALACAVAFPKCVEFWVQHISNEKNDFWERLACSEKLMERAFGRPSQSIEANVLEARKQILEVRWLPPDPNDRSRLIEPEPD